MTSPLALVELVYTIWMTKKAVVHLTLAGDESTLLNYLGSSLSSVVGESMGTVDSTDGCAGSKCY